MKLLKCDWCTIGRWYKACLLRKDYKEDGVCCHEDSEMENAGCDPVFFCQLLLGQVQWREAAEFCTGLKVRQDHTWHSERFIDLPLIIWWLHSYLHCQWQHVSVYLLEHLCAMVYRLYILVIQTIWDCGGGSASSSFWESGCWLRECSFCIWNHCK